MNIAISQASRKKVHSVKINHLLSDLMTRINIAIINGRRSVVRTPSSVFVLSVLKILEELGIVKSVRCYVIDGTKPFMDITLDYRVSCKLVTLSTPGHVVHLRANEIPLNDLTIVSTSQGVMTGKAAVRRGIGGKMLVRIKGIVI